MVRVTIFIEGDFPNLNSEAQTIGSNSSFREGFHTLFSGILDSSNTDLVVVSLGSINQTHAVLDKTREKSKESLVLIDLDWPKKRKKERLQSNYNPNDWHRIFFMIQEMEAWILSQPDKIELFGKNKRLIFKKTDISINQSPKLKDKLVEDIVKPSLTLNRIFKDYFETKKGNKTYSKTKDGPELITLLDPRILSKTFDEFENLITKIHSTNDPL